jgi:eukaryotic-like serine/threonine-protein kinase
VKVTDFGFAKAIATPTLTGDGTVLGTAAYVSPEQAQGRPVDARADLYAVGCVLHELLTGTPPFAAESPVAVAARHVSEPPESPSRRNPSIGPGLDTVVLTALAKRPADRYQTATAMAADLERAADGHPTGTVPLPADPAGSLTERLASPADAPGSAPTLVMAAPEAARRSGRRRRALAVGAGIVALLAVALWLGDRATTGRQPSAGPPTSSPPTTSPAPTTRRRNPGPTCRRRWPP